MSDFATAFAHQDRSHRWVMLVRGETYRMRVTAKGITETDAEP
jgi:hypothetical protein